MADPAANGLGTLDGLGEDLLMRIIDGFLTGRDAARLACASKLFKDAVMASRWPPWSPEPHILADGTVCEPLSGRFNAVIRRNDDGWADLTRVVNSSGDGDTILIQPGTYFASAAGAQDASVHLNKRVYIFGRGQVVMRARPGTRLSYFFRCSAAQGVIDGVSLFGLPYSGCLLIKGGCRIQHCSIHCGLDGPGCVACEPAARPIVTDSLITSGTVGLFFYGGAGGSVTDCLITECMDGIAVRGGENSNLNLARNTFRGNRNGVEVWRDVDAGFSVGEGNVFENNKRSVKDKRRAPVEPGAP